MLSDVREQLAKLESQLHYVESRDRNEAVVEAERLTSASAEAAEQAAEEVSVWALPILLALHFSTHLVRGVNASQATHAKTQLEEAQSQVAKAESAFERLRTDTEVFLSKVKEVCSNFSFFFWPSKLARV